MVSSSAKLTSGDGPEPGVICPGSTDVASGRKKSPQIDSILQQLHVEEPLLAVRDELVQQHQIGMDDLRQRPELLLELKIVSPVLIELVNVALYFRRRFFSALLVGAKAGTYGA